MPKEVNDTPIRAVIQTSAFKARIEQVLFIQPQAFKRLTRRLVNLLQLRDLQTVLSVDSFELLVLLEPWRHRSHLRHCLHKVVFRILVSILPIL